MRRGAPTVLAVAATVPLLVARLGVGVLRATFRSRRSVRAFRRHLRRRGIDPETARRLTATFRRQTSLRHLVGTALRAGR